MKCKLCKRRKFDEEDVKTIKATGHCVICDKREANINRINKLHWKYLK